MIITFAGVGSAGASRNLWQSNMLIEKNEKLLLVDAGDDIRHSLAELPYGINNGNIGTKLDAIYLSHLHGDHVHGLEHIALMSKYCPPHRRPHLYAMEAVMNDGWEHSLSGGLRTIEGKVADLTDFFDCHTLQPNGHFEWEGLKIEPVQTIHIVSGRMFQPSFGLFIHDQKTKVNVFITTDTQFAPSQLQKFYNDADVIFEDCETSPFRSNVHAHYDDLKTLKAEYKKRMWLYHYNQDNPPQDAVKDGFAGFVRKGQQFHILSKKEIKSEVLAEIKKA